MARDIEQHDSEEYVQLNISLGRLYLRQVNASYPFGGKLAVAINCSVFA